MIVNTRAKNRGAIRFTKPEKARIESTKDLCHDLVLHGGATLGAVAQASFDQLAMLQQAMDAAEAPLQADDEPTPPPPPKG